MRPRILKKLRIRVVSALTWVGGINTSDGVIRNGSKHFTTNSKAKQVLQDIRLRELLDEVESYYAFSNLQLGYWRDISVSQGSEFLPYMENQIFGSGDSVRVRSG